MSTKGAALFGIVAMLLWTIRMTIGLAKGISGVAGGFLPLNTLAARGESPEKLLAFKTH